MRFATSEDQAFLLELNRLAYEELVMRQFGAWDEPAQRSRFEAKLRVAEFRIVEFEGRPVGAVWSSENDDHVFLHELLILPRFQGRGIGSQILRGELDRAVALGKPMRLHTLVLSRAQEFFRARGFLETSRDAVYVDMEAAG